MGGSLNSFVCPSAWDGRGLKRSAAARMERDAAFASWLLAAVGFSSVAAKSCVVEWMQVGEMGAKASTLDVLAASNRPMVILFAVMMILLMSMSGTVRGSEEWNNELRIAG